MMIRHLAAGLVLLALPVVAHAQTSTATITASATVQASLTSSTTHQLKFGTLSMGASSTLASSGGSQAALSGLSSAGLGQVQVAHNSNVSVTATVPSVLTNTSSGQILTFSATCATANTSGGTGTAAASCASFSFPVSVPGTVRNTYILVGGTVTGNAAAGVGTFTGDINFTFSAVN